MEKAEITGTKQRERWWLFANKYAKRSRRLGQDSSHSASYPTLKTASARKLESFSKHEVEEESFDMNNSETGYRFVDLSSIKQPFQDCHNCDDAEVALVEVNKNVMDKVLYSPCNAQNATKRHFCKLQSQGECLGNPRMLWISIEGLCMLHLRLGLAEKCWQLFLTFWTCLNQCQPRLGMIIELNCTRPTKQQLKTTFSLQEKRLVLL